MAAVEDRLVREADKTDPAVRAAVRSRLARARLHQGLRARHPRERRAVHARRDLGRAGDGPARPRQARAGVVRNAQPGPPCARLPTTSRGTWSNRTSWRRTSTERRRIQGGAVGRGTPALPAWLYRVGLEAILGFHKRGDRLRIDPCVAPDWPRYELIYRHRSATYHIVVENTAGTGRGVRAVTVDARAMPDGEIPLMDDGQTHEVRVALG